jgi:predicted ATP-grasp superfamily ATP-dependent carboligase
VVFPTSDEHLEWFNAIHDKTHRSVNLPFTPDRTIHYLNKQEQYKICKEFDIPFPKTIMLTGIQDISLLKDMELPLILKPTTRKDILVDDIFRNIIINTVKDIETIDIALKPVFQHKLAVLASEIIPGASDNIYAYTCYANREGKILAEWTGQKLSQFPNYFGVFSRASSEAPDEVQELGRKLVNAFQLHGIIEPEFKFDRRDGKYKLMEANLRSMMWHRVGALMGINLHTLMYYDLTGIKPFTQDQKQKKQATLIYWKYELINLITRKNYYKILINIFKQPNRHYAGFRFTDLTPFLFDLYYLLRQRIRRCFGK